MPKNKSTALDKRKAPVIEAKTVAAEASIYGGGLDLTYQSNFIPASSSNAPIIGVNWHRAAQWALKQYDQNATAHRAIEIIADHIHGLGLEVNVKASDDSLKDVEDCLMEVVTELFFGKVNRLNLKLRSRILESITLGEAAFLLRENENNGKISIGYLDPRNITEIEMDAFDQSEARTVTIKAFAWKNYKRNGEMQGKATFEGAERKLQALNYDTNPYCTDESGKEITDTDPESGLQFKKPNPNCGMLSGEVLYMRNPNLPAEPRGRSDIHHVIEWLQWIDNGVNDFLRRLDIQGAVVMDVLFKGVDENELKEKAKKFRLPTGRVPWLHNEGVEMKMQSPAIQVEQLTGFLRTLIVLTAGSIGIPEFALGDGSQTNVATAREQMPTLYAKFDNRRIWWQANLQLLARFALERANAKKMLYRTVTVKKDGAEIKSKGQTIQLTPEQLDKFDITAQLLPYDKNTAEQMGKMLKDLTDTLIEASGADFISKKTAAQIFRSQMSQLGVDIDQMAEDAQIQEEKLTTGTGTSATGNQVSMQDVQPNPNQPKA